MTQDHGRQERAKERYYAAAHRVQTCIAFNLNTMAMEPKHLRVGIDMSKVDQAALANLLIKKGLFTLEEYLEALADQAEVEAKAREDDLSAQLGVNVTTI